MTRIAPYLFCLLVLQLLAAATLLAQPKSKIELKAKYEITPSEYLKQLEV
jgi:hypothetical protein